MGHRGIASSLAMPLLDLVTGGGGGFCQHGWCTFMNVSILVVQGSQCPCMRAGMYSGILVTRYSCSGRMSGNTGASTVDASR